MENWAAALFVWEQQTCLSSTGEVELPKAKGTCREAHDAEAKTALPLNVLKAASAHTGTGLRCSCVSTLNSMPLGM